MLKAFALPELVSKGFYFLYALLLGLLSILGLAKFSNGYKIYAPIIMLSFSYFLLLVWSFATFSDQLRYVILFIVLLLCPLGVLYLLEQVNLGSLARSIVLMLFCLLFISIVYSWLNYSAHPRISGVHNNPNLMGIWLVSVLAIVLYFEGYLHKRAVFFAVAIVATLVLSTGSRLAFITLSILLLPYVMRLNALSLGVLFSVFIFLSLYWLLGEVDLNFRSIEIGSSISDSGRISIWKKAIDCITLEPLTGHGMLGTVSCVEVYNVHNSYLRVAVMIGVPLSVVFFASFFAFLFNAVMMSVSPHLKFYFMGLPLAFFGEDYIIGLASPFFPFFVFILGLFLYDLKHRGRRDK